MLSARVPRSRVRAAKALHPALWRRVRGACRWAAEDVDLDDHAAGIVETVVRAQGRKRR